MSDNIVRYTTTAAQREEKFCKSCDTKRVIWRGVTEDDEMLTCCTMCSYVIERAKFRALT